MDGHVARRAAPGAMFFAAGLATMRIAGGTVTYFAPLDDVDPLRFQPAQAFADWWSASIMRDSVGNNFTRSDLVLSVADQDGGAHIDERLNAAYAALTRINSLGFAVSSSGPDGTTGIAFGPGATGQPFSNSVALANVREIAWEVENTLDRPLVAEPGSIFIRASICPLPFSDAPDVDRNDPCPCGSGRKYKHCFGRRQPRRFKTADEIARQTWQARR